MLAPPYSPIPSCFLRQVSACPIAQISAHYMKCSSTLLHLPFNSRMKELNTAKKTAKTSNLSAQLRMTAITTSCSETQMFYFTSQLFITINLFFAKPCCYPVNLVVEACRQISYNGSLGKPAVQLATQASPWRSQCCALLLYVMSRPHSLGIHSGQKPYKKG